MIMNMPMSMKLQSLPFDWRREGAVFLLILGGFLIAWYLPVDSSRLANGVHEGFALVRWYAHEHTVLCLLPAFVIAGAIAVFISQDAVMRYLGPSANKITAYEVASVSGSVLAVCSCTVLPLFGGIYRRGAGLGPAMAFLYSGPAINVLAVILTARILGVELGLARALGAVLFAVVIGLLMHFIFRADEAVRAQNGNGFQLADGGPVDPAWATALSFALMIAILVFANWASPGASNSAIWTAIYVHKWELTALTGLGLGAFLVLRHGWSLSAMAINAAVVGLLALLFPQHPEAAFAVAIAGLMVQALTRPGAGQEWFQQTWDFAKQILPLLLIGVFVAGVLLGRPEHEGLIPSHWVAAAVGGNGVLANFAAAVVGSLMYFATLTEVPIVQGLLGAGMGKGPALALLLAGPAVSLPNLLVVRGMLGLRKTLVYAGLVITMATLTGVIYGTVFG